MLNFQSLDGEKFFGLRLCRVRGMHAGICARSCIVVFEQGRAAAVNNDANMTEHKR